MSQQHRHRLTSQRGASIIEMLTVVGLAGVLTLISAPALWSAYKQQQVREVSREAVQVMRYTRLMALKEKVPHRVVFRDAAGSPANTIEAQRLQSGTFVTMPGHVYTAPKGVYILGSGLTDSVNQVTVGTRGECNAGKVFIQGYYSLEVVSIETTCHARAL